MWESITTSWLSWLAAADRAPLSVRLRAHQIQRFATRHPAGPMAVTVDDLTAWLARADWSTETRRSNQAALRSFFGWLHATGQRPDDPSRLLLPIKPVIPRARPAPDPVVDAAITSAEPRVRVMIMLAARQGLRRGEICRVHLSDVAETLGGWDLVVHGKGRKDRVVPLADDVADAVLRRCRRDEAEGWCFPGADAGHLSPGHVGKLISRALPDGWTAHTLRHRFATAAYAGTRDLAAVQELLGHSRPETTRRYIAVPTDYLRAAVRAAA